MERMKKMFEDFEKELRKMGANDERVNVISNGLADVLFFSLTGMGNASERMKKNIVKDARQKAVLYLRAVKLKGVDKFDPEKVKFDRDSDEMFESFSDVSWGFDDDDDDDDYNNDDNDDDNDDDDNDDDDFDDDDDDDFDDDDFDDDDFDDENDDDDYDTEEELENILEDFTTELKKMKVSSALITDISKMLTEDITGPLESLEAAPSDVRGKYINGIRQGVVFYLRAVKLHGAETFAKTKEFDGVSDDETEFESFSDVEW